MISKQPIDARFGNFNQIILPSPYDFPSSDFLFSPQMQSTRDFMNDLSSSLTDKCSDEPSTSVPQTAEVADQSDLDESGSEEDISDLNPYLSIIYSDTPRKKPSNWRSLVLFNGRLNDEELFTVCPKPQCDDGSLLPEIRESIKRIVNPDGTLRDRTGPALTMQAPGGASTKAVPNKPANGRGYISANGRAWFRKKPDEAVTLTVSLTTPTPTRKRYPNQSMVTAGGKWIHTDNSNECIAFAQSGKCVANNLCNFDHNGQSDHRKVKLCRDQMLGACRNELNCSKGLHGLSEHQIPVCHFYLRMSCIRDPCPYLHIKHQDTLEYCSAFQKGACLLGLKCPKPHRYSSRVVFARSDQALMVENKSVTSDIGLV